MSYGEELETHESFFSVKYRPKCPKCGTSYSVKYDRQNRVCTCTGCKNTWQLHNVEPYSETQRYFDGYNN